MAEGHWNRTRRRFIALALGWPVAASVGPARRARAQGRALPPTPACGPDVESTPAQTEGPFFKGGSPRRTSIVESGVPGTRLVVTGTVLSTECQPVPGAVLEFWQADHRGEYDRRGYRLRGHQLADQAGRYRLETIVPGAYPGRTRHIHVKVHAPDQPWLTTQLYFPGEPANERDVIFDPALVMSVEQTSAGSVGTFDFVLDLTRARAGRPG